MVVPLAFYPPPWSSLAPLWFLLNPPPSWSLPDPSLVPPWSLPGPPWSSLVPPGSSWSLPGPPWPFLVVSLFFLESG
ncbi:hypothetical protein EV424DRAFT_1420800, partial [Suillus variegatus]